MRTKIFCCALGFFMGAVATDWLASRASVMAGYTLRLAYREEQQALAACARQRGDLAEAARLHTNAVAASAADEHNAWVLTRRAWPLGVTFTSLLFEPLVQSPDAERTGEGIARALLADTLEEGGQGDEARAEYAHAARLLTHGDVRRARAFVASSGRVDRRLARSTPGACYSSRTAGTAGVGASSSIR